MTTRRAFLQTGVAAGGVLLVGFHIPRAEATAANTAQAAPFAPDAFIRVDRQGNVTLIMPQVEMGQGIYTAVAMILAEELGLPPEQRQILRAAAALHDIGKIGIDDTEFTAPAHWFKSFAAMAAGAQLDGPRSVHCPAAA